MKTDIYPYELLVRWKDGKLSGAHFQRIAVIKNGDTVISEQALPPEVIPPDQIADIYPEAQALSDCGRLLAERQALIHQAEAAERTAKAVKQDAENTIAALRDECRFLQERLKAANERARGQQ